MIYNNTWYTACVLRSAIASDHTQREEEQFSNKHSKAAGTTSGDARLHPLQSHYCQLLLAAVLFILYDVPGILVLLYFEDERSTMTMLGMAPGAIGFEMIRSNDYDL